LADLGLEAAAVGITKFCERPDDWRKRKVKVGGTKDVKLERVAGLCPDLILANREENTREQVEALANFCPVWVSEVRDLSSALVMISLVGALCAKTAEAERIGALIRKGFAALPAMSPRLSAAYFIWRRPYMTVGGDTFIHDMMRHAGFANVFGDRRRYPEVDAKIIEISRPDVILLSSEPYPFGEKHLAELQAICPRAIVKLVDGSPFSWYGSRLTHAPVYFQTLREELEIALRQIKR
jgi:ABC-type Fe3+-hydroxamate transport system substrate-binding protein